MPEPRRHAGLCVVSVGRRRCHRTDMHPPGGEGLPDNKGAPPSPRAACAGVGARARAWARVEGEGEGEGESV